jgi:ribosomal protein L11 methyltransferase
MLHKLILPAADLSRARAAEAALAEMDDPQPLAVTIFEDMAPAFVVEAYFATRPSLENVTRALAEIATGLGALRLEDVPDENWVARSQAALPPVAAGRFTVHGSHDRHCVGLRRAAIEIEAGEAFGTGHNATTTLCLEAVDLLARGPRWRIRRVLDLGCGSGVLAIAAARAFTAATVLAVDNDPVATDVARGNVRLNRVAARVRVLDASGFGHAALRRSPPFDLILANILPNPLIAMAPAMRRHLRPGGVAILSGLLAFQTREVAATYAAIGFRLERARTQSGWTALLLARR